MPFGVAYGVSYGVTYGVSYGSAPLSYTIVASGGAAATSIAFGTHQAGDVVVVSCRRANTTPPTIPGAGAGVPTWLTIESAGADALSLTTVYAIASDDSTVSGTFTNAGQIEYIILRFNKVVTLGAHAVGNAASTQTIVYPALTRDTTDGACLRTATRAVADSEVGNAPTGWTNRITQPAAGSATLCLHTQDSSASNPTLDSVPTTGTDAAYRAHTFEFKAA